MALAGPGNGPARQPPVGGFTVFNVKYLNVKSLSRGVGPGTRAVGPDARVAGPGRPALP